MCRLVKLTLLLLSFGTLKAQDPFLFNGPEYTGFVHGTKGHPFFLSDTAMKGTVLYDNFYYTDVDIGYNMADQQVYIREPVSGFNMRLLNEKIAFFSIGDHRFLKIPLSNGQDKPLFYEVLYNGHIDALVLHEKKITPSFRPEDPMLFREYESYFIRRNDTIYKISSANSLIDLFSDRKADIRAQVKLQQLNFRRDMPASLVKIARYMEHTTSWPEPKKLVAHENRPPVQQEAKPNTALEQNRVFEIGKIQDSAAKAGTSLAGYVRDSKTGESIIGATVLVEGKQTGVITDQTGYYSIRLDKGSHVIRFTAPGMKPEKRTVQIKGNGELNVEMTELVASLKTVLITAEKTSNVKSPAMSVERLNIKTIKQVPVVFGEADVMRVLLTLPGVSSVGEAGAGFNVRGGSTDQNLILFSDATIYNPSHLFGFFSAFNPDVVKSVELYKSAIPEKYGGRLSSVLEVTSREGNSKKLSGTGGIGLLTSKLTLEGPLIKNKATFIVGGRTTYSNWLLRSLPDSRYSNSRASFSDLNLQLNFNPGKRNTINITGYLSDDHFRLNNDTSYGYGNRNLNLKWKHIFNNRFTATLTGGYDEYHYSVASSEDSLNAFRLKFNLSQVHGRLSFVYTPSNSHSVEFGVNSIYYTIDPGKYEPNSTNSLVTPINLQQERALETGFYIGDKYNVTSKLSLSAGLRYSLYQYLGPYQVDVFAAGIPRDTATIVDKIKYDRNKVIAHYAFPEYRFSARYALTDNASIKLGYNTTRQFIHMLTNTTIISPTDIWKLSDQTIKPQQGYQVTAGFYHNFMSNAIETSIEFYYKRMQNVLDYKSGAKLILNEHLATDVINARGKSYGVEFLFRKNTGKFNGWVSYTYSRTFFQQDDPIAGEVINHGNYYPSNFDKPHNANLIANYKFTHRISVSLNVVYTTGRPVTIPISIFDLGGAQRTLYSDRNQYRIPDYFRTDLSFMFEGNHKVNQKNHNYWSIGAYNLTARKNPYSVYFVREGSLVKGYQLSIFGTVIPFVSYNFRF